MTEGRSDDATFLRGSGIQLAGEEVVGHAMAEGLLAQRRRVIAIETRGDFFSAMSSVGGKARIFTRRFGARRMGVMRRPAGVV